MFSLRRIGLIGVTTALLIGGTAVTGITAAAAVAGAPLAATVTMAEGRAANGTDPLEVAAVDITAGRVAWIDNSKSGTPNAAWRRGLSGNASAERTLLLERATGPSIAQIDGNAFVMKEVDQQPFPDLVKVGTSGSVVLASADTFAYRIALTIGGTSLLANLFGGREGDSSIVNTNTGALSALPRNTAVDFSTFGQSDRWLVRADTTYPVVQNGTPSTAIIAKSRATGVDATVGTSPQYVNGEIRVAGDLAVWGSFTLNQTNSLNWVDMANPAAGVQSIVGTPGAEVIATHGSRFAAIDNTGLVSVYTAGQSVPDFTVQSRAGAPFDFDSVWVTWVQVGPDGDKLVAARVPGTTGFTDVTTTAPFAADITWLGTSGVTTGYSDGTFRPTGTVTREAMAAFLYRFLNPGQPDPACTGSVRTFTDVRTGGFCGPIEWLATTGITTGFPDHTFRPSATITRQAMAAFLYRAMTPGQPDPTCTGGTRTFTDVPTGGFCGPIEWLATTGITTGFPDHTFKPGDTVTRQAMAAFLHRADAL